MDALATLDALHQHPPMQIFTYTSSFCELINPRKAAFAPESSPGQHLISANLDDDNREAGRRGWGKLMDFFKLTSSQRKVFRVHSVGILQHRRKPCQTVLCQTERGLIMPENTRPYHVMKLRCHGIISRERAHRLRAKTYCSLV